MILLVCGSPRSDGQTVKALGLIGSRLSQNGYKTRQLFVSHLNLPTYGLRDGSVIGVETWKEAVKSASAIVFGSPEYHGCFSGGLKNLIDHLDVELVKNKPAALVAASGGPRGGMSTLSAMRHVLRSLHMPVIVEQLAVCTRDWNQSGDCSKESLDRAEEVVSGLLRELERYDYPVMPHFS